MKKIVALFLALAFCVGLCGCREKKETVSPEDAIAPKVEQFIKSEIRFWKEQLYGEVYHSMTISDIVNGEETGVYDVKGVYTTVNEDGEYKYYAFMLSATYYQDGNVVLHEKSYSEIDSDKLAAVGILG